MLEKLKELIKGKSICILGFGREGQSTYHTIRKISKDIILSIADSDESLILQLPFLKADKNINFYGGEEYLSILDKFDIIFKTPGITLRQFNDSSIAEKIVSQSEVFIGYYRENIIGITGTKGKSTTASLACHILKNAGKDCVLVGNIGMPPFESLDEISEDTVIVYELSSHQLETLKVSPHTAVILNFFQEHLDHYNSYIDYKKAKMNIAKYQNPNDVLIFNMENEELFQCVNDKVLESEKLAVSLNRNDNSNAYIELNSIILKLGSKETCLNIIDFIQIKGEHNLTNCMVASLVCKLQGVGIHDIEAGLKSFEGLRHRIEFIGSFGGVNFYNDSIATIPQATMEAIKTIGKVDFLILGGVDRGVDYSYLATFLSKISINNILCIGKAGAKIYKLMDQKNHNSSVQTFDSFDDIFVYIKSTAKDGDVCLLSPAAASYDMFKNFEDRGNVFCELAKTFND